MLIRFRLFKTVLLLKEGNLNLIHSADHPSVESVEIGLR